ncbi:MAG TPA: hypothetical protein VK171_11780 [Fimbriimonas sp.]|nr:hypothetical protein [Fimbriimonas sp.]
MGTTDLVAKGGKREGAGRPANEEPTKPRMFRLTDSQHERVKAFVKAIKAEAAADTPEQNNSTKIHFVGDIPD